MSLTQRHAASETENTSWRNVIRPTVLIATMLLASAGNVALGADKFEKIAITLEQNIEDQDVEVKFDVISGKGGLAVLKIVAPDGRTVIDFKAPDSKFGIAHLTLESPEPRNDGKLQADFPEGIYQFTGTATGGDTLRGEATLTHKLPAVASLVRPRADEKNVPIAGLLISWTATKDADAITVLVEDEKNGRVVTARLSGTATTFAMPEGFLVAGASYKLAIGTIAKGGNKTVTEISFTTAAKK